MDTAVAVDVSMPLDYRSFLSLQSAAMCFPAEQQIQSLLNLEEAYTVGARSLNQSLEHVESIGRTTDQLLWVVVTQLSFRITGRHTRWHVPQQKKQFVDLAAGKRHTLFVSDDGLVFSVGEGQSWQLGTTSQFINHPDRRAVQRLPKQVMTTMPVSRTPSGENLCALLDCRESIRHTGAVYDVWTNKELLVVVAAGAVHCFSTLELRIDAHLHFSWLWPTTSET